MNRLQRMAKNTYSQPKQKKNWTVPEFDNNGKVIRLGNQALKKRLIITGIVLFSLYLLLYVPGLFMRDKPEPDRNYATDPDISAVKVFNDYIDKTKTQDFDGDNLDNATERSYNINSWDIDTDMDGVSDYYEIYSTKTSPSEYNKDLLEEMQKKEDKEKGTQLDVPYKCGNVILWANDYTSKARGGVIETTLGYHFSNFDGYAQFPHDQPIYAYTKDSGEYKPLKYLEDSDAWEINGDHNIVIFGSPLEEVTRYSFFKKTFYFPHNFFGSIMTFLLPEKGWLTAKKTTIEDVEPTTLHRVTADNYNIKYDKDNGERFKQKTNSLQDLQFVRAMIDSNRCVEVSLFNSKEGEIRGIIYGYDEENTLFVADDITKQPLGTIKVDEIGEKAVSYNGEYGLITYFKWEGLGYNSEYHDNISFFAVAEEPSTIQAVTEPVEPEEEVIPTPTDAVEVIEESTPDEPEEKYDWETDADYEIPDLYTGEWNHTGEGFINIMSTYTAFSDNTEDKKTDELYSGYIDDSTIQAFSSYTGNSTNVIYLWVAYHLDAKDVYDYLVTYYKTDTATITEASTEVCKEITITDGDMYYFIRRYTDDTFIIITSSIGETEEIQNIIHDMGNNQLDTEG